MCFEILWRDSYETRGCTAYRIRTLETSELQKLQEEVRVVMEVTSAYYLQMLSYLKGIFVAFAICCYIDL